MTDITYPYQQLPSPHFESSGIKQKSNLLKTEMSSGRTRVRQKFKSVPSGMSVRWRLTPAQAEFFLGWVAHALDGAVNPFLMNMRSPGGVVPHEFRFLTHPLESVKQGGTRWIYSAKMEVKELPVISEEKTAVALLAPDTVEQFVDGVDVVINNY